MTTQNEPTEIRDRATGKTVHGFGVTVIDHTMTQQQFWDAAVLSELPVFCEPASRDGSTITTAQISAAVSAIADAIAGERIKRLSSLRQTIEEEPQTLIRASEYLQAVGICGAIHCRNVCTRGNLHGPLEDRLHRDEITNAEWNDAKA